MVASICFNFMMATLRDAKDAGAVLLFSSWVNLRFPRTSYLSKVLRVTSSNSQWHVITSTQVHHSSAEMGWPWRLFWRKPLRWRIQDPTPCPWLATLGPASLLARLNMRYQWLGCWFIIDKHNFDELPGTRTFPTVPQERTQDITNNDKT